MGTSEQDEVTRILAEVEDGDPQAGQRLLPLVYEELRSIARQKMRHERRDLTLQATALVHEAYLRLLGEAEVRWDNRGHFFGAAAEAMRRILVERARRSHRQKHGGGRQRVPLEDVDPGGGDTADEDVLALDGALRKLEREDRPRSEVVKLRYFAGLTIEQTAEVLGISEASVSRHWNYARAWLRQEIAASGPEIS